MPDKEKTMSLISVIVPVYKVEDYLCRCIDSILAQTYQDFELILVDDGSPDRCPEICDTYMRDNDQIHVIHKENGGLSSARNAGIDWVFVHSDSEWIAFIDSDDWIHPKMIESLIGAVLECETKISMCRSEKTNRYFIEDATDSCHAFKINSEDAYVDEPLSVTAWGKLYAKECFRKIRYPLGKLHEDEFVTYKLLFMFPQIAVVPEKLYYYFSNPTGIINSAWSPKRMVVFDAFLEKHNYFVENNYIRAAKENDRWYIISLVTQYNQMKKTVNKNEFDEKKLERWFRKKLRIALRQGRKEGIFFTVSKDVWIYEVAYPKLMQIYWYYQAAKKRLMGGW